MDDENNVNLDTSNEEGTEPIEIQDADASDDTTETPEVDAEQLQATNKKLYERAKKAEAELKALRGSAQPTKPQSSPQLNVEETVLLANGMPEELLAQLKKVAQVQGVGLIKAQNDPIFVAVKEKFEKDKKQRDASLPASRGSGSVRVQKTIDTPGLSREDHMSLAKQAMSRL